MEQELERTRRRGRKRRSDWEGRELLIGVRLTPPEWSNFRRHVAASGTTNSAIIRNAIAGIIQQEVQAKG